jgi:2-polyprenyl-6-methoxyphenol hydroxylase-like FAD-dependent oxidoreductase
MSAQLPVLIIGAGLAGLTVARALLRSKIPAIVFEASAQGRSPGYGLTLRPAAYRPLLEVLSIDETTFKQRVAVDAAIGGSGKVQKHLEVDARHGKMRESESESNDDYPCRVNKRKLRDLLAENIDIRWEHKFKSLQVDTDNVTATFENGETVKGSMIVAADGVHSIGMQSTSAQDEVTERVDLQFANKSCQISSLKSCHML